MTASERSHVRIGIDVGGTYTDFVALSPHFEAAHHKQLSTPEDPSRAVVDGLKVLIERLSLKPSDIESISHGTTIAVNAIIQRRGADMCLVVSRGHRDVMGMTQRLPSKYSLRQTPLPPLVSRDRVIEIDARLDARGGIVSNPSDEEIARVAGEVRLRDTHTVALTVLHSYRNAAFEGEVANRLSAALDGLPVAPSALTWPEIREYDRTSVVTLNAYISPLMHTYLADLESNLMELGISAPLYITASNGGSLSVAAARERPIDTVLSGPAAGVTATLSLARREGISKFISFDMGGTSSDIAVAVEGEVDFANRTEIGGLPLILPVVEVNGIGAGGGSIAGVGADGFMHVGPESAGAIPGPVSYGRGGTSFTIMDAYVASGFINPEGILGASQKVDRDTLARSAKEVGELLSARRSSGSLEDIAAAVLDVATVNMASEAQKILARRGYASGEFTLVAFGGGGPTHAALLAEEIGISRILVPLAAGTYCALGAIGADLRRDFLRGIGDEVGELTVDLATSHLRHLFAEGQRWVAAQGARVREVRIKGYLHMRYRGQVLDLEVAVAPEDLPLTRDGVAEAFHRTHEHRFGHRDTGSDLTLLGVQVAATGVVDPINWDPPQDLVRITSESRTTRQIRLHGQVLDAQVIQEEELATNFAATGPAVIDLPLTTVVIPPGWRAARNASNSLELRRLHASDARLQESLDI